MLKLTFLLSLVACTPPVPHRASWRDDPTLRTNVYEEGPPEVLKRS